MLGLFNQTISKSNGIICRNAHTRKNHVVAPCAIHTSMPYITNPTNTPTPYTVQCLFPLPQSLYGLVERIDFIAVQSLNEPYKHERPCQINTVSNASEPCIERCVQEGNRLKTLHPTESEHQQEKYSAGILTISKPNRR